MLGYDGGLQRLRVALEALPCSVTKVESVLSVGCGQFHEMPILQQVFSSAMLIGVDMDWHNLPRWHVKNTTKSPVVIAADGAALPFARLARYDLILLRHPDVDRRRSGWRRVVASLVDRVRAGGCILVSCYAEHEMVEMREALLAAGMRLIRLLPDLGPVDLTGNDRFMLAASHNSSGMSRR